MKYLNTRALMIIIVTLGLIACLGGGGGNSGSSLATFSGLQDLSPNRQYALVDSQIQEGQSFTSDNMGTIITADYDVTVSTSTTVTLNTNSQNKISGFNFTTPEGVNIETSQRPLFSWITGNPVTDENNAWLQNTEVLLLDSEQRVGEGDRTVPRVIAGMSNPQALDHDYQTYGVWTIFDTTNSGQSGAFSAGSVTAVEAIPSSGSATYNGTLIGDYIGNAATASTINEGGHYTVTADMSAAANFDNGNIDFSTSNTAISREYETVISTPELDLTGQLTLSPDTNQFTGMVDNSAVGGDLTGEATGRFYGPTAEELGGTFSLTDGSGSVPETYTGAFGGKR